jgi:hypothetical protein
MTVFANNVHASENIILCLLTPRIPTDQHIKKYLLEVNEKLLATPLGGIEGITNAWLTDNNTIETDGSNMQEIFGAEGCDHTQTISNDPHQMFHMLGIEAARATMLNELQQVLSYDGSYVDQRHLSLVVDRMTFNGKLSAVSRHGFHAENKSVLSKSSYECVTEAFSTGAYQGKNDLLQGVSENIMVGNLAPFGTGNMDILLGDCKHALPQPVFQPIHAIKQQKLLPQELHPDLQEDGTDDFFFQPKASDLYKMRTLGQFIPVADMTFGFQEAFAMPPINEAKASGSDSDSYSDSESDTPAVFSSDEGERSSGEKSESEPEPKQWDVDIGMGRKVPHGRKSERKKRKRKYPQPPKLGDQDCALSPSEGETRSGSKLQAVPDFRSYLFKRAKKQAQQEYIKAKETTAFVL